MPAIQSLLVELELLELLEPDELEESDEPDEPDELPSLPATFFFLPDLKSVSYQPPPFRRKPAADTFLIKASVLHCGQVTNGSSLSF